MKPEPETLTTRSKAANAPLRGIAIFLVFLLHFFSNLGHDTYTAANQQIFFIPLDQFARFCVPMFVMLSGYAFWAKFSRSEWSWQTYFTSFLFRQAQKLLPLYILTSAIFMIFYQQWSSGINLYAIGHQLLFGKADYHLYFISMIFQLYLVFPILFWLMKKALYFTVAATFIFQFLLYLAFSDLSPAWIVQTYFPGDQAQYLWFFSWVWYAVLGMLLAHFSLKTLTQKAWLVFFLVVSIGCWIWISWEGISLVRNGIDPVVALRGTRVPVLFYATTACVFFFSLFVSLKESMRKKVSILTFLGNWSYPIYLFHTIALRLIFTYL